MMTSICMPTTMEKAAVIDRIRDACDNATSQFEFVFVSNPDANIAQSMNACLKKIHGEAIIFIGENLCGYPKGWDKILIDKLMSKKDILVIGPDVKSRHDNDAIDFTEVAMLSGECMAYRRNNMLFDVNSGEPRQDFIIKLKNINPSGKILLCNKIKLRTCE